MGLVQLTGARGPEALPRVVSVPEVQVALYDCARVSGKCMK